MSTAEIYLITIIALVMALLVLRFVTRPIRVASRLEDHDLSNLRVSATSTEWMHSYACSECNTPIGHEEFMTDICLTCGRRMSWPKSRAFRYVVRGGHWVRQQSGVAVLLELSPGKWVSPEKYDKEKKTP